jgi:hypothetical protein
MHALVKGYSVDLCSDIILLIQSGLLKKMISLLFGSLITKPVNVFPKIILIMNLMEVDKCWILKIEYNMDAIKRIKIQNDVIYNNLKHEIFVKARDCTVFVR